MLMAICTSLRRVRPNHMKFCVTRNFWHWHLQHVHRKIYVQSFNKLDVRDYVQAPEARPLPDDRNSTRLQQKQQPQQPQQPPHQQQSQPQQKQSEKELQQGNLQSSLSSSCINQPKTSDSDRQDLRIQGKNFSSFNMPSGVEIPYPIDWVFLRLRNPTKLWYITSQIIITIVGLFSKFVLIVMNKTKIHNRDRLIKAIIKRPKGVPLVTVSNHYSCFDDPGVWGALPLRYLCNTFRIRWSMAAHDICFTNKLHSKFFMYGKCIPVVRGIGVYQDAINLCIEKCALGHWVHVFPEGKVNMTKEEIRLKWGVGRIIYESPQIPIILPMWHEGMDSVLPNVEPYKFQWRKKVTINVGNPLDLNAFVQNLKDTQVPEPQARKLITDKIQEAFRSLRNETEDLHGGRA